jgi:hypothetical protein
VHRKLEEIEERDRVVLKNHFLTNFEYWNGIFPSSITEREAIISLSAPGFIGWRVRQRPWQGVMATGTTPVPCNDTTHSTSLSASRRHLIHPVTHTSWPVVRWRLHYRADVRRAHSSPVVFARASGLISAGDTRFSGCWFDSFAATERSGYRLWLFTPWRLSSPVTTTSRGFPDDMTDPTSTTPDALCLSPTSDRGSLGCLSADESETMYTVVVVGRGFHVRYTEDPGTSPRARVRGCDDWQVGVIGCIFLFM